MENTYEGYWFRSHRGSDSFRECGLYKEDKHHQGDIYDDDIKGESHVDDRIANKDNEKLLSGSEITMGIQEFLEMGMKYKVNIETKEDKYTLEIEPI
ncbi:MAG: hypothetical protein A3D13_06075 [Planctomycetes bacterium RIFCSPHIGHO2_02_FULL_40_12]|nr:MAG: hypothetical protein A3D13_06075 [Planctomycetes bacterium RIFCSPHIGHO2_02_FULL_40_12]OHC04344.1 MAG: hypothetical protein A3H23_01375 [Planctomycetes bacterium RIFCSPLOWO2_12_FULL_40_19]